MTGHGNTAYTLPQAVGAAETCPEIVALRDVPRLLTRPLRVFECVAIDRCHRQNDSKHRPKPSGGRDAAGMHKGHAMTLN